MFVFFAIGEWSSTHAPQPASGTKPLDYSKPIVTGYSAMICPLSLLADVRADHDANTVIAAFSAITGRTEKAEALGCEILQEGIPVKATKMSDSVVGVSLAGLAGSFFTMEDELKNPEGALSSTLGNQGSDSMSAAMASGQVAFQKAFPNLDKSTPNLRWFDDQIEADSQESASLVTPFGPCIDLVGNKTAGYSLLFVGNYYHAPQEKGRMLGSYQDRLAAIHASEDTCRRWYATERSEPPNEARDTHIWFAPEQDTFAGDDAGSVATLADQTNAPEALPSPDGVVANPTTPSDATQPPAPIERRDTRGSSSPDDPTPHN